MQQTQVQSLGREDPLEKEVATRFSILAWEIPLDRGAGQATVVGVTRVNHERLKNNNKLLNTYYALGV